MISIKINRTRRKKFRILYPSKVNNKYLKIDKWNCSSWFLTNREFEEYLRHDPRDEFANDDRGDNGDGDRWICDFRQCSLGTGNRKRRRTSQRVFAASTSLLLRTVGRPLSTNLYPSIDRILERCQPPEIRTRLNDLSPKFVQIR